MKDSLTYTNKQVSYCEKEINVEINQLNYTQKLKLKADDRVRTMKEVRFSVQNRHKDTKISRWLLSAPSMHQRAFGSFSLFRMLQSTINYALY